MHDAPLWGKVRGDGKGHIVTTRENAGTEALGILASELSDEDVRRELRHLYQTRWDALTNGSESAFTTHTKRMHQLEEEFLRRFPAGAAPDPMRTRAGRRQADGQD